MISINKKEVEGELYLSTQFEKILFTSMDKLIHWKVTLDSFGIRCLNKVYFDKENVWRCYKLKTGW